MYIIFNESWLFFVFGVKSMIVQQEIPKVGFLDSDREIMVGATKFSEFYLNSNLSDNTFDKE